MGIVNSASAGVDLPQLGEAHRLRPAHWFVLLLVLMFFIVDGIDMQILGVTVAAIAGDWKLPFSAFGAAMAAGHAGAALGALLGGALGDRIGRRPVMIRGALLFGALTFCMMFATAPSHLVALRFLAGMGLGGCMPPGLALLSECMPPRHRNFAVALAILCSPIGIAIAGVLASTLLPLYGWKAVFIIAGLLPIALALVLLPTLPESPRFLFKIGGRDAEARRLMERFGLADAVSEQVKPGDSSVTPFREIFGKGQLARSLSLFGVFFLCYLSTTMILSWLPALLSKEGFGEGVAGTVLVTWSLTGMVGVVVAGFLMARFGSSLILGVFLCGSIVVLAVMAVALPLPGDTAGLKLFYGLIALGGFMVNGTMTTILAHAANVFAPHVRSTGIGLSTMCGRLGGINGAFVGVYLLELTGANGFFGVIAAALMVAFLLYLLELFGSRRAADIPLK